MGVKLQSTDIYKQKVFAKRGDKVEILSEYLGGTEPIDFVYHCEKHGDTYKTLNAKNVLASCFQPCKQCDIELKSSKGKSKNMNKDYQYNRLKQFCESKGGKLISTVWTIAKDTYEIHCGNPEHPNFFSNADGVLNSAENWCPYCCGRKGNFEKEITDIINSKNGILLTPYKLSTEHVSIKCNIHNYIWPMMPLNIKKGRWCPVCNLPYSEKVPYDYLVDNYPSYNIRVQYTFDDLMGENGEHLKYDLGILDDTDKLLGIVEIDDDEHRYNHTQPRRVKARERDKTKDKYCKDNNIPLFRLEYYNGRKMFKDRDWYYNYIHKNLNEFLNSIINK